MDNKEIQEKQVELPVEGATQETGERITQSRRRLFRQGASVVAVTLASRPVLAWHCQSPSAWGSEQISAKNGIANSHAANGNKGHAVYQDETWTIANWINNTSRNGFGEPWKKLKEVYSSLYDNSTKTNGRFDYSKVTVAKLFAVVPGLGRPDGLGDNAKVKEVLSMGSDLQKYTIVAQLNFILLAPYGDLDKCITLQDLSTMATGTYYPLGEKSNVVWGPSDIKQYLYNNWIVRPS